MGGGEASGATQAIRAAVGGRRRRSEPRIWARVWTKGVEMSAEDVDVYLARVDEPKRSTLEHLRRSIAGVIPEAEQERR